MESNKSQLDHYTVLRTLGKGVSAKVKSILEPSTNKVYAAKILYLRDPSHYEHFLRIMSTELEALSRLTHPNILRLISFNESGLYRKKNSHESLVRPYMVLDLCTNGELYDILAYTGGMSEEMARLYFSQILSALGSIHSAGFAHRDLKPENLLFDADFNLKISDFGFSALLSGRDGTGQLFTHCGTQAYMAPEILAKQSYSGESVDLFALGIILFIMVIGSPPFLAASTLDKYYKLFLSDPHSYWKTMTRQKKNVSDDFKDLVSQMIAFNPQNRLSIEQILNHPWTNGNFASIEQTRLEISYRKQIAIEKATKEAEALKNRKQNRKNQPKFRGNLDSSNDLDVVNDQLIIKDLPNDGVFWKQCSHILTGMSPKKILKILKKTFEEKEAEVTPKPNSYDLKVKLTIDTFDIRFKCQLYRAPSDLYVLVFTLCEGDRSVLLDLVTRVSLIFSTFKSSL